MKSSKALGLRGENLAASFLVRSGYSIVQRNFRFKRREIDLIIRRGDLVAFVEVKARAGSGYGHPLEAITARKRREVERAAKAWVVRHGLPGLSYRFDAVAIQFEPSSSQDPVIEHIPGAWRLGE